MKKPGLKILIIFALFLFSSARAEAACSWEEQKTYFDKSKGSHGETVTTECSSGSILNKDTSCSSAKPTYEQKNGVASKAVCCCKTEISSQNKTSSKPKFKLPDYVFQVPIGTLTGLKMVDCSSGSCEIPFLAQYIVAIYKYGLSIAGVLGVLMLMAAGLLWLVSGGDSGKINQAKKMIFGSVFGLLLLVGLSLFLGFINPDLAITKVISLPSIQRIEIESEADTDIMTVGGKTIYKAGCEATRNGDLSVCRSYGNIQPAGMITVKGIKGQVKIDSNVYQKYLVAIDCVKSKNGGKPLFGINEAFRNAATQLNYWDTKPKGKAAPPCCSNHSYGEAMDVNRLDGAKMSWAYNDSSGLTACMNAQGLYAKIKSEAWHWSLTGK